MNDRLTADVWGDFTPFLLRIRMSSLNKNCSWYIGLSFRFKVFARWSYGLAVKSSSILAVRLIRARLNRNEPPVSVADRFRPWPPCGVGSGRASPALCPARPRQADARLQHASTRPLLSAPSFRISQPPSLPTVQPPSSCSAEQLHRHRSQRQLALVAPPPPQHLHLSSSDSPPRPTLADRTW